MDIRKIRIERGAYNRTVKLSKEAQHKKDVIARELDRVKERVSQTKKELKEAKDINARQISKELEKEAKQIEAFVDSAGKQLQAEIEAQNVVLRNEINAIRRSQKDTDTKLEATEHQIDSLSRQFNDAFQALAERAAKEKERAILYADQLNTILSEIEDLHPDKLSPDQISGLRQIQAYTRQNLRNGDYQAAIATSQTRLPEAIALLASLRIKNDEYERLMEQILTLVSSINNLISEMSDTSKQSSEVSIDTYSGETVWRYNGLVDFWSDGIFGQLCEQYRKVEDCILEEYKPNMDLENLRTALRSLPKYVDKLRECGSIAMEEFVVSCRAQITAIRINDVLQRSGWTLEDSGFDKMDERRAYCLLFRDGSNNYVPIVIIPETENDRRVVELPFLIGVNNAMDNGMSYLLRAAVEAELKAHDVITMLPTERDKSQGKKDALNLIKIGNDRKEERVKKTATRLLR